MTRFALIYPKRPELSAINCLHSLPQEIHDLVQDQLNRIETGVGSVLDEAEQTRLGIEYIGQHITWIEDRIKEIPAYTGREHRSAKDEAWKAKTKEFELEYLKAFKEEYGVIELLGIPNYAQRFPIDAAFVTLSLAGDGDMSRPLAAGQMFSNHRQLVIKGDAGTGKTTLMQWEAVQYCTIEEKRNQLLQRNKDDWSLQSAIWPSERVGAKYNVFQHNTLA